MTLLVGVVAQLVEHHNGIVGVIGSNPFGSTTSSNWKRLLIFMDGRRFCFQTAPGCAPAADAPQKEKPAGGPHRVNQHIPRRTLPPRNVRLMPFIGDGKQHRTRPRAQNEPPRPTRLFRCECSSQCPPQDHSKDCILREVRALAHHQHRRPHCLIGNIWDQPAHDGFDDTGGMVHGLFVT